jgi:hypothetical protein
MQQLWMQQMQQTMMMSDPSQKSGAPGQMPNQMPM